MKFINIIAALSLVLFIGCGGGSGEQQQGETEGSAQQQGMASGGEAQTIEIIGVDQMQFVVEEETEGITAGEAVGPDSLLKLEGITASPGQEIHIRLTTRSQLPASAMAHNFILLQQAANVQEFVTAAMKAKDNDYIPQNMSDQIIAHTELAAGGETVEVTFTAPEQSGEYEFICSFPGHFAAGMRGTLTVQ